MCLDVCGGGDFSCVRRFRMRRQLAVRGLERAGSGPFDQQGDKISDPASVEDTQQLAAIAAVELEASRRDPYRQLSRPFHLVGRKAPN